MTVASASSVWANETEEPDVRLAQLDKRLTLVAERLMLANAPLCRNTMPFTGMTLLSVDQFKNDDPPELFAAGPVAVVTLAPGSPILEAGILQGDNLIAIAGTAVGDVRVEEDMYRNEALVYEIAKQPEDVPLPLTFRQEGALVTVTVPAAPTCLAFYEVALQKRKRAHSNGRAIQISRSLMEIIDDKQLAVVFAHELAHSILEHRRRLSEANVRKGLLGEFGRNRRYNRQVEIEADRLLPHLLFNAGYDPAIAPSFFRSPAGRRITGGLSFVYSRPSSRAELVEEEIATYLADVARPSTPHHLLHLRDELMQRD